MNDLGISDVTNQHSQEQPARVKTCGVTGKRAEPDNFGECAFTKAPRFSVTRLLMSDISGKRFQATNRHIGRIPGQTKAQSAIHRVP